MRAVARDGAFSKSRILAARRGAWKIEGDFGICFLASLLTGLPQSCCYLYKPSIAAQVVLSLQITGVGLEEPEMDPRGQG
jgi:hypothetical protein